MNFIQIVQKIFLRLSWSFPEHEYIIYIPPPRLNEPLEPSNVVNKSVFKVSHYIIHLLDRTETNIIFIWSGEVILGEAKPSPNITLSDHINMILGEVLSNKCFIIPATLCAPGPSHALLIQTKRPFTRYQCAPVQVCVLRHLISNVEFY